MKVKYLILGAGVSGLSFADKIINDDYLICDANEEIGGYCRTVKKGGFTWDYSGHFFHFKNENLKDYLINRMENERVLDIKKESRIFWKDRLIEFPFQKNIHQLPKEEFIDCLYDLFFKNDINPSNFKDMLYSKFGQSIANKFLIPYNEKLYATDLTNLDMDAMGRFFPYAQTDEIIRNFRSPNNESYNSKFTYPEGGAIQYVNALAQGVDPNKISLGERAIAIDLGRKVAQTTHRSICYDYLISSAPFNHLLLMTGLVHERQIYNWNKVLVFNIGFDLKSVGDLHWIYFPQKELCYYRVGFYDNILKTNQMSIYVELGFPKNSELNPSTIKSYKNRVISDLKHCGIVTTHQPVAVHSVVMDPAYVHITKRSINDVALKKKILENYGVHSIGRYGGWKYCSIEDNIIEARETADTFNATENL